MVSVALEKVQVTVLAEKLEELLDQIVGAPAPRCPAGAADNEPLEQPVDEEFRVGTLAWPATATPAW